MRRDARGPGVHVHEGQAGPELVLLQQVQGLMGHLGFIGVRHKLVQVQALRAAMKSETAAMCLGVTDALNVSYYFARQSLS